jgi:peroxiredoxin
MSIAIGQAAPDFSLFDSAKQEVQLNGLKGNNVLLLFFPFAFSSVCTSELCSVRDNFKQYEQLGVKVFGISVDSLYTLAKFKEAEGLNFTLLSDFNKEVCQAYGAFHETFSYGMRGVSKRAAFLIDKEGIIQYSEVLENPGLQPNFSVIQEVLEKLNK